MTKGVNTYIQVDSDINVNYVSILQNIHGKQVLSDRGTLLLKGLKVFLKKGLKVNTEQVNVKLFIPVVHVNLEFHDTCTRSLMCIHFLETLHIQVGMDRLQHQ
jgi:hypothetical protein